MAKWWLTLSRTSRPAVWGALVAAVAAFLAEVEELVVDIAALEDMTPDQRRLVEEKADVLYANPTPQRRLEWKDKRKNLTVLIRFSDHVGRTLPSVSDIETLMNHEGPHNLCPTGSVRDVFLYNSYNQLDLTSNVTEWVTLSNTETYYTGANNFERVQEMIGEALDLVDASGFDFGPFDDDGDGKVDAIAFLHSGYAAEFTGAGYRVWSHKGSLHNLPEGRWTSNDDSDQKPGTKTFVYDYHVSPSLWSTSGSAIGRIGVIAHETGHYFGLPDLYDTNGGGQGIGS
jgi:M6 family metalloprotease-like protein